ncbi:MAG: tryptophan-rich sensory protein [Crocinitomicaceae bacterium]|nr:tryptophan-rich sensory protein [Crocinitomicaceae bacterium]
MWLKIIGFLFLNFGALALGGLFAGSGADSNWYAELNKAPWTPPGWVFGFAWTTIMLCFSIYMATLYTKTKSVKTIIILYVIQWMLNVAWNPVFFYFHKANIGLILIVCLTILVAYFLFNFRGDLKAYSIFILPYFIWLCIATSLNAYISLMN